MTLLAREIVGLLAAEFGTGEVLARLSDPYWFQAFGCVLGFDWHSSGVTTTVCGAVKEALKGGLGNELGLFAGGGKGNASRKTPDELREYVEKASLTLDPETLVYASRMSAKVDNTAVQDGYQLYHHVFLFDASGAWAVVQQGMHDTNGMARRYHWLSSGVEDFVNEPHAAICAEDRGQLVLNMTASEADESRRTTALLAGEHPDKILKEAAKLTELAMPRPHPLPSTEINPRYLHKILLKTYERKPEDFKNLLEIEGVGPATVRALALIADLVYGIPASTRDPARFSFAHGGKDGFPYPVDRQNYDRSISVMKSAVEKAKMGEREKVEAVKRLARFYEL